MAGRGPRHREPKPPRELPVGIGTPLRMFRFLTVAAAIGGACAIAALALGVAPVLVASGGSAALRDGLHRLDPAGTVLTATATTSFASGAADRIQGVIAHEVRGLPLGPPVVTAVGPVGRVSTVERPGRRVPIQLVTRRGFESHVGAVAGPAGDGVWLPQTVATALHVGPGDTIVVYGHVGVTEVRVPVAAVYRDITAAHVPQFWEPVLSRIRPRTPDSPPPPPFLQAGIDEFGFVVGSLTELATLEFDYPLGRTLTLPEGEALVHRLNRLSDEVADPATAVYGTFASITSNLPSIVADARRTVDGTTQPVRAISLAGGLLALIAAGVTGRFMARRRAVEYQMLSARGVGPGRLGARTVVEGLLPAVMGAAAGAVAAVLFVRYLGPGGKVGPQAVRASVGTVVVALVLALLAFGLVAGRSIRAENEQRGGVLGEGLRQAPWEAAALALAMASLYEIHNHGTPPADAPPHVDLLVLLFPFLFLAGTVGITARWVRRGLPRLRAFGARRSAAPYLAFARLSSAPRLALTLVTSAALGMGVLAYGAVLSASLASTAGEKATLSIGSDVVVGVGSPPTIPGHPSFGWTPVQEVSSVPLQPGGQADLLVVDASTFVDGAFWDERFDGPASEVMARLGSPAGDALPVVAVGDHLAPGSRLVVAGASTPLEVVRSVPFFPGTPIGGITLVADREAVARTVHVDLQTLGHRYELWAKGDPNAILPVLRRVGFPIEFAVTSDQVRTSPAFLALHWTFGLLQALGVLAGVVAGLATVLYLQARQQSREVAYALARRMGLQRRQHRRSVLLETGSMLAAAFVLGTVFAVLAASLVHGRLDPIPALPPSPVLRVPLGAIAVTAVATFIGAAVGAWRVQSVADRARVGEVMRLA